MKHSFYKFISTSTLILIFVISASAQTQSESGIEFYRNGEYQKASEILQKAVEVDKKNIESWLFLGMSFARLKMKREAVDAFNKADKLMTKEWAANEDNVKITEKPRPSYTDAARSNLTQGLVAIAVEFGADGKIKYAFLVRTLPNGLTENAVEVLRKIKFNPAVKDGKPVTAIRIIEYSFSIR